MSEQTTETLQHKLEELTTQLDNSHSLEECTYLWVEITRIEGQLINLQTQKAK